MDLMGKVAIVTGGGVRIGRAIAEGLAQQGVRVCVHFGRSRQQAEQLTRSLREAGGHAACVSADLRQPVQAAATIFEFAHKTFGRVDILINSAAIFEASSCAEATEEQWDRHVAINLKAPFFLTQALARSIGDRRGHVVHVADWRAVRPSRGHVIYSLTKNGLVALTRLLALELAPAIQVNALALGAILPPEGQSTWTEAASLLQKIPLRQVGSPEAVVEAVLFLLRSDFITGEVLHITGGQELEGG
ncbi:MAG TPA: SDR family oxidoreductase [Planctomycetaceae bacterium]|nr:SDR family oxidoreductase [Planctomycetaceae bacterium]